MGDTILKCPLCCYRSFESKSELIEHLAIVLESITCPVCSNKWSSVEHLVEHLTLDNCQPENTVPSISFDINSAADNNEDEAENNKQSYENAEIIQIDDADKSLSDALTTTLNGSFDDGSEMGKIYVEFLSKQLSKPCLQTQELKLIKDDGGVSQYVFVMNENDEADMEVDAVVTKQNSDGTISLTTVGDMKLECDPMMNQEGAEPEEESQEEVYTCNSCGVSFTSVLDHIQNYHNDQDVVVEERVEDTDPEMSSLAVPIALEEHMNPLNMEQPVTEKQTSRRVITETGDIVETPLVVKTNKIEIDVSSKKGQETPQIKENSSEKKGRSVTRRYVVVDSVIKDIKQPENSAGPYHKVVVKEIENTNGEKIKIFSCAYCHIYVASLDEFKSHPCKKLRYSCTLCPVSYENSKSLCAHMKVHKPKPGQDVLSTTMVYECEVCRTVFSTNKSLKLHKRMHDPIKARPIEPPVENSDGMEVSNDKFLCSVCNKLIPMDYRDVHQKSHKGKPELNCDICNKAFQSQEYLEMHMNVHLSEKILPGRQDSSLPYTCLYCDRRFSRPHEKVKHERIHTGEKPHSCEICGKSFRVSYCLTLHMRTHTGARPYSCQHCGKRFKAHSVYNHHLLTHSEVRAYKCPYCPKAFKTSVQLAGHKNSHTKPFSCQHCNRPFASLYAVRVHTETHARQNSLKFSCSMCGASYARAFALKDHIKAVHNKDAEKLDLDKDFESMLGPNKEPNQQVTSIVTKEDWTHHNGDKNASTEIINDTKTEVNINEEAVMVSNFSEELIAP